VQLQCPLALAVRWIEGVKANAVSVGTEGQIILVTDNGHLVIYGIDGQLIVDHSLPEDVQKPRHAVFSPASGTFIVSHSSVSGGMHRYAELTVRYYFFLLFHQGYNELCSLCHWDC